MATIKTQGGKVVLKDGKPSCDCCAPECSNTILFQDVEIELTASAYAALYAGGTIGYTAGSTVNMSSGVNAGGAIATVTGNLTIEREATTTSNSCFTGEIEYSDTEINNSISASITPPSSPYDTLLDSFLPGGGAYISSSFWDQYGIRLNRKDGKYYALFSFGFAFIHLVGNIWVDEATEERTYASALVTNNLSASSLGVGGTTEVSIDLSIDGVAFPFLAYTWVTKTVGGLPWEYSTTEESTASFSPLPSQVTFVSSAP